MPCIFCIGCLISCNNAVPNNSTNEMKTDSIAAKLKLIDSLRNAGTYCHIESWNIGRIVDNGYKKYETLADRYSVDVYVNRLSNRAETLYYLQLSYWESSSYSERRETKIIDLEELKSFYSAIDDIKKHYGSDTDHYELYLYQTKDGAILSLRRLIGSNDWDLNLCSIAISQDDLDKLKILLKQAESKIAELKKAI